MLRLPLYLSIKLPYPISYLKHKKSTDPYRNREEYINDTNIT